MFITGMSHIEEVSSTATLCCINISTQAYYCRPILLSCLKFFCRSSPVLAKKYSHVPSATNELKELCRELFNAVKDCTVSYFSLLESSFCLSSVIGAIKPFFLTPVNCIKPYSDLSPGFTGDKCSGKSSDKCKRKQ